MRYLIIIFAVGLLSACSSKTEESVGDDKPSSINIVVVDEAGMKVPAKSEIDTVSPPVLTFIDELVDFGTIDEGDIIFKTFKFKNTGQSPLIITDAKASCGCTVPEIPVFPILPGESGEIKIRFNATHKKGGQDKSIRVAANTYPSKVTTLRLKGYVNEGC